MGVYWQDEDKTERHVLAFPKPARLENPDYLRYIRRQPCICCGAAPQAHHSRSKSIGGSDYRSLPLCWKHHNELHNRGVAHMEITYRVDLREEVMRRMETYLAALREGENLGAK